MTMPHERTRSLLWAHQFLVEIRAGKHSPEELQRQAHVILRHLPDAGTLDAMAVAEMRAGDTGGRLLARVVDGKVVED